MPISIQDIPAAVSFKNSSSVVPTTVSPFIGLTEDILQTVSLTITLATAQSADSAGTLIFEFSPDGINWDISVSAEYYSTVPFIPRALRTVNRFFRLRYIPYDNNLTEFRLTTLLNKIPGEDITRILGQNINVSDPVKLTGAVLLAQSETDEDQFVKITSTALPNNQNGLDVSISDGYGRALTSTTSGLSGNENALVVRNIPIIPATSTLTSVPGSITAVTLISSNPNRKGATIYNDSSKVLYVALGAASASTTSFTVLMVSTSYYEVPFGFTGRVSGVWSGAVGNARISELT